MDNRFTPKGTSGIDSVASEARIKDQRRQLRLQALAAREALSQAQCAQYSEAIRRHVREAFPRLAAQRVAFCWPIRNEPDLRPLMTAWLVAGAPGFMALLPVVEAPARPLVFRAWTPQSAMITDRHGIPTPVSGESAVPEALLIPVNAFDAQGYRIGYGGGFFDRTLAALAQIPGQPRPLAIGVGYAQARVETTYPQAHDVPLNAVVTEAGVHWPPPLK